MAKPIAAKLLTKTLRADHHLIAVFNDEIETLMGEASRDEASFLKQMGFVGRALHVVTMPNNSGHGLKAWFGLGDRASYDAQIFRALPGLLPHGAWSIAPISPIDRQAMHGALGLGAYRFDRYKQKSTNPEPVGVSFVRTGLDEAQSLAVDRAIEAHRLVLDLINTPAEDMGPFELEACASDLAKRFGARLEVIKAEALLKANYPMIHAVGRAAAKGREPRLLELSWSPKSLDEKALPVIVLVGKGVCFDTGGLNIKTGSGMGLMKKDMGGAAHVLGLAQWIMAESLPIKLHVLVAAVENSISGASLRPSDVIKSRKGLSVEVGNTDAEGRLVLGDCLTRADELRPDLTIDFATLTGAARVALGPQLVPLYCADEAFAHRILLESMTQNDPLWRMPLWSGYEDALDSSIADITNDSASWAQAGSVTAALFLQRFAPSHGIWAHLDIYGWNPKARPGNPIGAAVQGLRAVMQLLRAF